MLNTRGGPLLHEFYLKFDQGSGSYNVDTKGMKNWELWPASTGILTVKDLHLVFHDRNQLPW